MLFLRSWLEEYINLEKYSNNELKQIITMKSGEVEEVIEVVDYFDNKVLLGKIENVRKHEDADKLKIFDVNLGEKGIIQIVSAALNVKEGLIIPVATIGAVLPMGRILERNMRGTASQGMCCGKSELMMETEYSSGLWEVVKVCDTLEETLKYKNDFPIVIIQDQILAIEKQILGKSICEVFPEYFPKEYIFDIKYLADKISACSNYLGLALDISICLEDKNLLTQKAKSLLDSEYLMTQILAKIEDKKYSGTTLSLDDKTGYTNSLFAFDLNLEKEFNLPHLYQKRMFLTGKNQIGGIADLSNYLLYDIGQPTHFFSKQKLLEKNLNNSHFNWEIKKLESPSKFKGLGQLKNTTIPAGVEVLVNSKSDEKDILTIPGISGSEDTKAEADETNIVIEVASFSADRVATTSFAVNYRSEGAKIWAGEVNLPLQLVFLVKLLDILGDENLVYNIEILLTWINPSIEKILGIEKNDNLFKKATKMLDFYSKQNVKVDLEYISDRLDGRNLAFWLPIIEEKLSMIGKYRLDILHPNIFYGKIKSQEDILEQISRLIGFENLEPSFLNFSTDIQQDLEYKSMNFVKEIISEYGFYEVITRPFVTVDDIADQKYALKVVNPYNSSQPYLRDNIFSSLLKVANSNILQGIKSPKIFELNKIYKLNDRKELVESIALEAVSVSDDPYLLTSLIQKFKTKTGGKVSHYQSLHSEIKYLGEGYTYHFDNQISISLIELSNKLKKQYNIPLNKPVWVLSLDLTNWNKDTLPYKKYYNETSFPVIERNYSIKIDKNTTWEEVAKTCMDETITECELRLTPLERISENSFDKLNFAVEFVSYKRTLEGGEIQKWENSWTGKFGGPQN